MGQGGGVLGLCHCGCGQPTKLAPSTHADKGHVKGQPLKYLHGHGRRRQNPYLVRDCGFESPCWIFDGQESRRYPIIRGDDDVDDTAHRVFYKRHVGPIPVGHHVHHKCRQSRCVNPDHLEALPMRAHLSQPRKRRYSDDDLAVLHARNEAGESQVKIARSIGIAQAGVSILLRRYRMECLGLPY